MTQIEIPSPATYVPVARSFLYKSLSVGFAPPTRDNHAALRDGRFMNELWDKLSLIGYLEELLPERTVSILRVSESVSNLSYEDLAASYARWLERDARGRQEDHTPGQARQDQDGAGCPLTSEVRNYYEVFGLSMETVGTPWNGPDHLALKLEFLHYLTLKEFQAGSHGNKDRALDYLQVQRGFLERHLLNRLCLDVVRLRPSSRAAAVYLELMRIASEFVRRDIEWILMRINAESRPSEAAQKRIPLRIIPETWICSNHHISFRDDG